MATEAEVKLNPKIDRIRIGVNSTWLSIEVQDTSVWVGTSMYSHRLGNFGEVEFRHINKEFVESLRDKLTEILENWGTNNF